MLLPALLLAAALPSGASAAVLPAPGGTASGFDTAAPGPYGYPDRAGDVNGDGRDDLVVEQSTGVKVVFSPSSRAAVSASAPGWTIEHSYPQANPPYTGVAPVGDFDGDGRDDLFVTGGYVIDTSSQSRGAIAFGPATASTTSLPSATASVAFVNSEIPNALPTVYGIGDVDGDGFDDVVARASDQKLTVLYGGSRTTGDQLDFGNPGSRGRVITAPTPAGAGFSYDVAALGDVNGDRRDDFAVIAVESNKQAWAYVILGSATSADLAITSPARNGRAFRVGPLQTRLDEYRIAGDVLPVGDLNGDGLADLAVGGGTSSMTIVRGRTATSDVSVPNTPQKTNWALYRPSLDAFPAGDVNGDGYDDLVGGAARVVAGQPRTYIHTLVIFGKPDAAGFSIPALGAGTTTAGIRFGNDSAYPLGDVDGDGAADLATKGGIVYGYKPGGGPVTDTTAPVVSLTTAEDLRINTCGFFGQRYFYGGTVDVTTNEPVTLRLTAVQNGGAPRTATVTVPNSRQITLPRSLFSFARGSVTVTATPTDDSGNVGAPASVTQQILFGGWGSYICPSGL